MTKNLHDDALKSPLEIEDTKIARVPKTIDHSMIIGESSVIRKRKTKMNNRMVKSKMPVKKICRLEKATQHLYDLEDAHGPEKPLNIDFGLYQMEDY